MVNQLQAALEAKAKAFARYILVHKSGCHTTCEREIATRDYMNAVAKVEEMADEMTIQ